jgi:hypothetical protein
MSGVSRSCLPIKLNVRFKEDCSITDRIRRLIRARHSVFQFVKPLDEGLTRTVDVFFTHMEDVQRKAQILSGLCSQAQTTEVFLTRIEHA